MPTPGNGRKRTTRMPVDEEKSMSEQSLDDLLNDVEESETVEVVAAPESQDVTVADDVEAEQSDEAKSETDLTTESKKDDEPDSWTKAAALDERHKRQESERKVAELQQQLNELQQGNKKDRPDVFEDQDGAFSHLRGEFAAEIQATRLEISQEMMREKHEDYDVLESEFIEMAKDNPTLLKELNQSRNPARYAVETALKARQVAELKDVDKMRASVEATMRKEIEEKLKAEMGEAQAKRNQKRDALMPSLASAANHSATQDDAEESLSDLTRLG